MMGDDFEESETTDLGEEDEFQETEDVNLLRKKEEVVFCPRDGEYMPYKVKGAIVVRRCPKCGYQTEGGS